MKTLPVLLNSSDMLACGEDLGLIPSCVHPVCSCLMVLCTYCLCMVLIQSEISTEYAN